MPVPAIKQRGWKSIRNSEWKVIKLLADGFNQESIAYRLRITKPTVKRHVSNICEKLQVNTSLEIVCKFYQDLLLIQAANDTKPKTFPTPD